MYILWKWIVQLRPIFCLFLQQLKRHYMEQYVIFSNFSTNHTFSHCLFYQSHNKFQSHYLLLYRWLESFILVQTNESFSFQIFLQKYCEWRLIHYHFLRLISNHFRKTRLFWLVRNVFKLCTKEWDYGCYKQQ